MSYPVSTEPHTYRVPTNLEWEGDGYRAFQAVDATDAISVYREKYPSSSAHVDIVNLQVSVDGKWQFSFETPVHLGGHYHSDHQ